MDNNTTLEKTGKGLGINYSHNIPLTKFSTQTKNFVKGFFKDSYHFILNPTPLAQIEMKRFL